MSSKQHNPDQLIDLLSKLNEGTDSVDGETDLRSAETGKSVDFWKLALARAEAESERAESDADELQLEKLREQLKDLQQNRELRGEYARNMFQMTCFWLLGIYILLWCQGFYSWRGDFFLSDQILLAVIASSTVPGLLTIVIRYLFPDPSMTQETGSGNA